MNFGKVAYRHTGICKRLASQRIKCLYLSTDAGPTAPPLLLKIKSDLKAAMKAKDTNRLNVLRALLAETTNASKTSNPFKTDIQILSMLRKRAAASKSAAEEFAAADTNDLRDKEEAQIAVLEEYASAVEMVSENEIKEVVTEVISLMRSASHTIINAGSVMKAVVGPGTRYFEGKAVDKAEVAKVVQGII